MVRDTRRIFLNYRRQDSPGSAGRLYDSLARAWSEEQLFMDVDAVQPGADFEEAIRSAVEECDAFLTVIGPRWITALDEGGGRRLDDPSDYVRLEIEEALERGVRIIPVLVEGAVMPPLAQLPPSLQPLAHRNAVEIRNTRWHDDVGRLVNTLRGTRTPEESPQAPSAGRGSTAQADQVPIRSPGPSSPQGDGPGTRRARISFSWISALLTSALIVAAVAFFLASRDKAATYEELLLAPMTQELRATCVRADPRSPNAEPLSSVTCAMLPLEPAYELYADRGEMNRSFDTWTSQIETTTDVRGSCEEGREGVGSIQIGGRSGRLACFVSADEHLAYIVWTIDDLNVLAIAHADSAAVGVLRIYAWFSSQPNMWVLGI